MLHNADSFSASDCQQASEPAALAGRLNRAQPGGRKQGIAQAPRLAEALAGGRYGEQRGVNFSAVGLTILIHVVVIAALLGVRHHVVQRQEHKLVTVNLSPPPPPPPAPASQETPKQPVVTAPPPLIQIDLPQQVNVPVAVDPQPAPPSVEPVRETSTSTGPVAAAVSVIQGGDLGARMVSGKPPRYPLESRRNKEQGTVVLSLVLGTDGAVEQISVNRSSGHPRLDDAALHAVRRWRWEPVIRSGGPVKVRGLVEIPFVLQGQSLT